MTSSSSVTLDDLLNADETPSLPEVALRIIEIAQQPDPDPQELIEVVRTDPAIAGRILKFSNSALFGLRHRPTSVDAAVPMLGTTLVRALVLGFTLTNQTPDSKSLNSWFRQLWRESLFQACAAELLAERISGADSPTWFLAGLLQDIGQLAMLNVAGQEYVDAVLENNGEGGRTEREQRHFGFTHVDVSAGLCKKWNLEADIVAAISGHHDSVTTVSPDAASSLKFGLNVAADCSDYMDAIGEQLHATRENVERYMIEGYNYLPHEVACGLADMDSRAIELANGFASDLAALPPRSHLVDRAQSVLRQIAVENQLDILNGMNRPSGATDDDTSEWLDQDTSVYNRRYLDTALPGELERSHADGASVGLLEIKVSVAPDADGADVEEKDLLDTIRECVRPSDSVIRIGHTTTIVILQKLNADVLQRIAERIQEDLSVRLGLTDDETDASPAIGGVVVIPTGRKAAKADRVLKTLAASSTAASHLSSSRVAFQLLTGKKARAVKAAQPA